MRGNAVVKVLAFKYREDLGSISVPSAARRDVRAAVFAAR